MAKLWLKLHFTSLVSSCFCLPCAAHAGGRRRKEEIRRPLAADSSPPFCTDVLIFLFDKSFEEKGRSKNPYKIKIEITF